MKGIYGAARFAVAVALVAAVGQVQAKPVRYSFFLQCPGPAWETTPCSGCRLATWWWTGTELPTASGLAGE